MHTHSKDKAEWDGNDWREYTKEVVRGIGGNPDDAFLVRYLQREFESLYSEAHSEGAAQAWSDAYEAYN